MHIGLMMECDFREGRTQRQAFDEALATAEAAEALGFDGVWLAERHFAAPGGAAPVSSIGSAPLLLATAIATRTSRLRVGTAVLLLPLGHPVRLAEEVATLDHLSHGRLDLGIGRSSFPRSYEGYNIAYEESRARFQEYLDVMRLAWTQERFSYAGTFYTFRDVELVPKPYQHPHPPLHHAATTRETFAAIGTSGLPLLVGLVSTAMSELAEVIAEYQAAWQKAGHPGTGEVRLRLPIYVAESLDQAQSEPQASASPYYERVRQAYLRSAQTFESPMRAARAARLATLTYADVLQTRVVFGTPKLVTERLVTLRQEVGLSGIIMEPNVGGRISHELLLHSMRLFAQEVAPSLR
jgi:alkanesulfonate monooxygenase SsuD/methylene tetrahydromethanopterin reductase-like flavin-dependent oxidoreductase (luciferase family)